MSPWNESFLKLIINIFSGGSRIELTGWGANPCVWGKNLLYGKIFATNYMKMKEIGLRTGTRVPRTPALDPPMKTKVAIYVVLPIPGLFFQKKEDLFDSLQIQSLPCASRRHGGWRVRDNPSLLACVSCQTILCYCFWGKNL